MDKLAIVLFSGGLDSSTILFEVLEDREHHSDMAIAVVSINYGQRHNYELEQASRMKEHIKKMGEDIIECEYKFDFLAQIGGSSLTESKHAVPQNRNDASTISNVYVPFRNTFLLTAAAAVGEKFDCDAYEIYHGANKEDFDAFPDCRPNFFRAMELTLNLGAKYQAHPIRIKTPLLFVQKAEIATRAVQAGVPLRNTWSCYSPIVTANANDYKPCMSCDACKERIRGFSIAGIVDPLYQ